jgi:hypothetical protein
MSELMKAKEARALLDQALDTTGIKLKASISEIITDAISKGQSSVNLDIPSTHVKAIKSWLESSDYMVSCGSDWRETWFSVKW